MADLARSLAASYRLPEGDDAAPDAAGHHGPVTLGGLPSGWLEALLDPFPPDPAPCDFPSLRRDGLMARLVRDGEGGHR